jgi:hypothetical protein
MEVLEDGFKFQSRHYPRHYLLQTLSLGSDDHSTGSFSRVGSLQLQTAYNTSIQGFPANRFAQWFHFAPAVFFTAEDAAKRDVTVSFPAA